MLRYFPNDPVGWPGLAAMALGFLAFFAALLVARTRVKRAAAAPVSQSAPITRLWIVVQGIGIGVTGFGPIRIEVGSPSGKSIVEGVIVALLMAAAVALFNASSRAMGKNWAVVAQTRSDHNLVETGPFKWIRNPIYVAMSFFMFAMAIAFGHSRNLIVAVPIFALGTWMRVVREEGLLRAQFGAAYDDYAARVRRFVPGLF
ncbi:isoprenylcysteine carboxylmethyltransferase family protein [Sphingomonas sp.]|jgi:protein-S-isoprenylcysteine O-methyltransferase Ste14|uniref:methyltransferase family protein n=1 Tax=Sphingomonas sp. TaxID=28214 RepID=UPI002E2FB768|nr:isoprenylcysteine carboxylmethyltransferase family protein [Sphingomonas sp.]HEX4693978.1 isoprenylcysteine carboxylmethyltransferase family protein [Sphingomonas sp.]